jgi:mannose-6-phosphate isomerase-like protein (cupin superfamily)
VRGFCSFGATEMNMVNKPDRLGKVIVAEKLTLFSDYWNPVIVGEVNDCYVKLVKFKGSFCWHKHLHEDEMFLVVSGSFVMNFRDRAVQLSAGEFLIVPRNTEHMPHADEEVHTLLFEPKTTRNTGNVMEIRTTENLRIM